MTGPTANGPSSAAESATTIAWRRRSKDEILVTVNGPLDQNSRSLFRSVVDRAITQLPRRIVVEMSESHRFEADANDALIVSLEWQAADAGVALVSELRAAS